MSPLVPGQSRIVLGTEILILGAGMAVALLVPRLRLRRNRGGIAVNAWILLVEIQR